MNNILILDTETTGLSVIKDQVIEVAAILFNIESKTIIQQASTLIYCQNNEAISHNNISVGALMSVNINLSIKCQEFIASMILESDYVVCHNKAFDKRFVDTMPILRDASVNKQWICTLRDVKWPVEKGESLKLTNLCDLLGVITSYNDGSNRPHRALYDCIILSELLCKMKDIEYFLLKQCNH